MNQMMKKTMKLNGKLIHRQQGSSLLDRLVTGLCLSMKRGGTPSSSEHRMLMADRTRTPHSRPFVVFSMTLALLLGVMATGCGSKDGGSPAPSNVATTPPPDVQPSSTCAQGQTLPNFYAQPISYYGGIPYSGWYARHGYPTGTVVQTVAPQPPDFCNCPSGYVAVCDGQAGLTCVPHHGFRRYHVAWFAWSTHGFQFHGYAGYGTANPQSGFWGGAPVGAHIGPHGVVGQSGNLACNNQIGVTCQVGSNSCGAGSFCAPIRPGASLGICTR
jgi:hypothetical protein